MKDWRYAIRQLVKRPGLSAVVVLMLAFGIGTTTAIFSMYREVLLRPLPVLQPDRLVNLQAPGPKPGWNSCSGAGECEYVSRSRWCCSCSRGSSREASSTSRASISA